VFFLGLLVLTYSSIVPATGSPTINHFDKVQHAIGYGLLATLLALAWPRLRLMWVALLPIFYGVGMEIAQSITPYGRTGSLLDAAANAFGAIAVVAIWSLGVKFLFGRKS